MQDRQQLYFIAIIPPSPLLEELQKIKEHIAQKYHSYRALKSPPHITIIPPFRYPESQEGILIQALKKIQVPDRIFITLHNYNCFYPKVVFIHVEKTDELDALYTHAYTVIQNELQIVLSQKYSSFHPHITVAFKDIDMPLTQQIYEDLQTNFPIKASFEINKLSILKHNGKIWEIMV